MLAIAHSAVLVGLTAIPVRVEVQILRGVPSFELVGFAEAAVRESRVRVKSALAGVGVDLSEYRVVVNLAPADVRKRGSAFDLAIAVGTLAALSRIPDEALADVLLLGELSLNGGVQALRGVIPHLLGARERGVARAIVPRANEEEASLVEGVNVELASSLEEIVSSIGGTSVLGSPKKKRARDRDIHLPDLSEVRGQETAKYALEVAAAGGHNVLFLGPPGSGKSMLAKRLPSILPPLAPEESLEVLAIESVAGVARASLGDARRFRAPHHTVSEFGLVGGGELARPGEVSLAHCGVLFLDELAEFRRVALEALREPLEDGVVTVSRAQARATFPARPMIVGAMNSCPCGHMGGQHGRCQCRSEQVRAYRARVSGPVVDRLDVQVTLGPVSVEDLQKGSAAERSASVRARVEKAREIQRQRRLSGRVRGWTNAHLDAKDLDVVCSLPRALQKELAKEMEHHGLTARAYTKVLRVARTIADLESASAIEELHLKVAVNFRVLDRESAWTGGTVLPAVVHTAVAS